MEDKLISLIKDKAKELTSIEITNDEATEILNRLGDVDDQYINSKENDKLLLNTINDVLFEKLVDEYFEEQKSDINSVLEVFNIENNSYNKSIEDIASELLGDKDDYQLEDIVSEFGPEQDDKMMDEVMLEYIYSAMKLYYDRVFNYYGNLLQLSKEILESIKNTERKLYLELYEEVKYKNFNRVKNKEFRNFMLDIFRDENFQMYNGVSFTDNFLKTKSYIFKYVKNKGYYDNFKNKIKLIEDVAYKLAMDLVVKGYNYKDIVSKKYDSEINKYLKNDRNEFSTEEKVFSVDQLKNSIKTEYDKTKEKVLAIIDKPFPKRIIATVLLTLVVSQFLPTFTEIGNKKNNDSEIGVFDTYDYPKITDAEDNDYSLVLDHLRKQYPEYLDMNFVNTHYEQLCLYDTYQSISKNSRMSIMNGIINYFASYYQLTGEEDFETLSGYNTYYRYMYVMLAQGTYKGEKVDVSKYSEAVLLYEASVFGRGEGELTNKDKRLLEEMEKLYTKYIEEVRKDLEERYNHRKGR